MTTSTRMHPLVDARALWWHGGTEECPVPNLHDEDCDCIGPGWELAPFGGVINIDGTRYVTDRFLLIRQDRLTNWPEADASDAPFLTDFNTHPSGGWIRETLTEMLAAEADPWAAADCEFDPRLLDPLRDAGYDVQPTVHPRRVHAVVDAVNARVGALMPRIGALS